MRVFEQVVSGDVLVDVGEPEGGPATPACAAYAGLRVDDDARGLDHAPRDERRERQQGRRGEAAWIRHALRFGHSRRAGDLGEAVRPAVDEAVIPADIDDLQVRRKL